MRDSKERIGSRFYRLTDFKASMSKLNQGNELKRLKRGRKKDKEAQMKGNVGVMGKEERTKRKLCC